MKHHKMTSMLALMSLLCASVWAAHPQQFTRPKYSPENAAKIAKELYRVVLEREADAGGLVVQAGALNRGELTAQEIALNMGCSAEYGQRFISNRTPAEAIKLMYRHFLLREPESQQAINHHVNELNSVGWQTKVRHFALSAEAGQVWAKFTDDVVSGKRDAGNALLDAVKDINDGGKQPPDTPAQTLAKYNCKPPLSIGQKAPPGQYNCTNLPGYEICEGFRKKGEGGVSKCTPAFNMEIAKIAQTLQPGCKNFLGREGNYLCSTDQSFQACETFRQQGKPIKCTRQGKKQ